MPVGSIIDLLTRYRVGSIRDPAENRLTAALAAVLELDSTRGLANRLGRRWLPETESATEVGVWCQRPVPLGLDSRGFIDLELTFDDDHVIWVEAKIHSSESGEDQLEKYQQALEKRAPGRWTLIALAPAHRRHEFDPGRSAFGAGHVAFDSWQQVYSVIDGWRDDREDRVTWLAEELLSYMKEGGLMETPLKDEHLEALKMAAEAEAALLRVLEDVIHALQPRWGPSTRLPKRVTDYQELVLDRPVGGPKWGDRAHLAWGVDLAWGDGCFAGVRYCLHDPPPVSRTWKGAEADWVNCQDGDYGWRYRRKKITEVTALPTLESQAEAIHNFVAETFEAL